MKDGWMNRAYSRLSTTHGHITDCKLDSVVSAGVKWMKEPQRLNFAAFSKIRSYYQHCHIRTCQVMLEKCSRSWLTLYLENGGCKGKWDEIY